MSKAVWFVALMAPLFVLACDGSDASRASDGVPSKVTSTKTIQKTTDVTSGAFAHADAGGALGAGQANARVRN